MMALGGGWGAPNLPADAPLGSTLPAQTPMLQYSPVPAARIDAARLRRCCGRATIRFGARMPPSPPSPNAAAGTVDPSTAEFPPLSAVHWPPDAYRRAQLPERVLQFGTGMLLRPLCAASVAAANSAGAFSGRIAVIQSTPQGHARAINAQ